MRNRYWFLGSIFILLSIVVVMANISLSEETNNAEGQDQAREDLSHLSTNELENRLGEVELEIGELETKQDFLKGEEPVYVDYSPSAAERTGFITKEELPSRLLSPMASKDIEARLDSLHHLKEAIEKELDKRGE